MKDVLEIVGASALVSIVALTLVPAMPRLGEDGAGAGGENSVTVEASNASVETLVETWAAPPEAATEGAAMASPVAPTPAPVVPDVAQLSPTARPSLPLPTLRAPEEQTAPATQDTAPPPPRMAPSVSPRPPNRPERRETARAQPATPAPASAPRVERTAKGAGNGATQGETTPREQAHLSRAQRGTLMSRWGSQIQSHLARRAPRGAGRGTAVVTIRVAGNGALVSVGLAKSSGNARIDRLAVQAVRAAGGFPKAPEGLGAGPFAFSVPIASR